MAMNAAAFFVRGVGLGAWVREQKGVLRVTLAGVGVDGEAVGRLRGVLKMEMMRWHPDQLGRRCEGVDGDAGGGMVEGGVNVGLRDDERARAVLLGIMGLVEDCKAWEEQRGL